MEVTLAKAWEWADIIGIFIVIGAFWLLGRILIGKQRRILRDKEKRRGHYVDPRGLKGT